MKKRFTIPVLFLAMAYLSSNESRCQVNPAHLSTLNFTSIKFEFPWTPKADSFQLVLFTPGKDSIVKKGNCNQYIIDNLEFGATYEWYYTSFFSSHNRSTTSSRYQFSIGSSNAVSPLHFRYNTITSSFNNQHKGYILLDKAKVLVTRNGAPVWYLPPSDVFKTGTDFRDLKMTYDGNFTCIDDSFAYEIDIYGNVLWKAPQINHAFEDTPDSYHHELTKLPGGNYLTLGKFKSKRKHPATGDSVDIIMGTILEFNPAGEIVWKWNSADYFTDQDLFTKVGDSAFTSHTHLNACSLDSEFVYAGYRDKSRIIKINRATGKVTETYGYHSNPNAMGHSGFGFFRRQHGATLLNNNRMAVFNNDSVMNKDVVSSVVIFERPSLTNNKAQLITRIPLNLDDKTPAKCNTAGNVVPLENGNYLVCMGAVNRCVELTPKGNKVWDMIIQQYNSQTHNWDPFAQYRTYYVEHLHPYAFTYRVIKSKKTKGKWEITLRVWNNGKKACRFSINYNKLNTGIESGNVEAGSWKEITFILSEKKFIETELQLKRIN